MTTDPRRLRHALIALCALVLALVTSLGTAALAGSGALALDPLDPTPTHEPTPDPSPEPTETPLEMCVLDPTPSGSPTVPEPTPTEPEATPSAPLAFARPALRTVALAQPRKPCTIDVTWVPLTSLFRTKMKPLVGDTLQFEVDITINGKMKDLVIGLVNKNSGGKQVIKVTVRCKVTAVDDGFDAVTVTCQPSDMDIELKGGGKVNVKFPGTTDKITAGISIVP